MTAKYTWISIYTGTSLAQDTFYTAVSLSYTLNLGHLLNCFLCMVYRTIHLHVTSQIAMTINQQLFIPNYNHLNSTGKRASFCIIS